MELGFTVPTKYRIRAENTVIKQTQISGHHDNNCVLLLLTVHTCLFANINVFISESIIRTLKMYMKLNRCMSEEVQLPYLQVTTLFPQADHSTTGCRLQYVSRAHYRDALGQGEMCGLWW